MQLNNSRSPVCASRSVYAHAQLSAFGPPGSRRITSSIVVIYHDLSRAITAVYLSVCADNAEYAA